MLLQSMAVAAATRAAERWVFLVRLNRKKSRAQPLALHVLHSYNHLRRMRLWREGGERLPFIAARRQTSYSGHVRALPRHSGAP